MPSNAAHLKSRYVSSTLYFTFIFSVTSSRSMFIVILFSSCRGWELYSRECENYGVWCVLGSLDIGQSSLAAERSRSPLTYYNSGTLVALFRVNQSIFVERTDPSSRSKAATEIRRRAEAGGSWPQLVIFPEGTCCNGKSLLPYKPGEWKWLQNNPFHSFFHECGAVCHYPTPCLLQAHLTSRTW